MRPELQKLNLPLPLAIIGLGVSGLAAKNLLLTAGLSQKDLYCYDDKQPSPYVSLRDFLEKCRPNSVCVSPGISLEKPEIRNLIQSGVRLTSELEIATAFLSTEKVIAVTGSIGKSTVTSIIGAAGKTVDENIFIGGNLGTPLAEYSLKKIATSKSPAHFVVLELSSYQLENYKNLKAEVGVLTYLSPNHLERYKNLQNYYDTKLILIQHIAGALVYNANGGDLRRALAEYSFSSPLKRFAIDQHSKEIEKFFLKPPSLLGSHNRDNLALAFKVCDLLQWPDKATLAALDFQGLEHRLENCGERSGILFINDSKATAMDPVVQAVNSVRQQFPERRIVLLLGGKDKNLPWENLSVFDKMKSMCFHFFGEVGGLAHSKSRLPGEIHLTLKICLRNLQTILQAGDILLFSPGGTSLDEFNSFEERGNYFKSWVKSEF